MIFFLEKPDFGLSGPKMFQVYFADPGSPLLFHMCTRVCFALGLWLTLLLSALSDAFDLRLKRRLCASLLGFAVPISLSTLDVQSGGSGAAVAHYSQLSVLLDVQKQTTLTLAAEKGDVIYKSGKTPEQLKNKNKDDKSGTKKDMKFLRCLSNCKTECQKPSDGLANLDCNQDCQDQCCESYEQCSFKVRTRSSEL